MVSLDNYTGIIQIDKTNQLVTVRGGTTLKEIVISLEDVGLSLPQLPSVSAQTISGAIATGVIEFKAN
jgi:L-gulonolactone oxidase